MIFSLADFWGDLAFTSADFYLPDRRMMEADANGPIDPIQVGYRTWIGDVSIRPYPSATARAFKAKIEAMKEADGIFFVSPADRQTTGQTGTVATIGTDRREITLSGVTPDEGDYLGINNGTTYGMHQVSKVDGGTVHVVPPVPLSLDAGDAATTQDPLMKVRMALNARGPRSLPVITDQFSLSFYQVLT